MTSLAKKIHNENLAGNFMINLAGLGIGNGIIAPEHNTLYADYLYQVRITQQEANGPIDSQAIMANLTL